MLRHLFTVVRPLLLGIFAMFGAACVSQADPVPARRLTEEGRAYDQWLSRPIIRGLTYDEKHQSAVFSACKKLERDCAIYSMDLRGEQTAVRLLAASKDHDIKWPSYSSGCDCFIVVKELKSKKLWSRVALIDRAGGELQVLREQDAWISRSTAYSSAAFSWAEKGSDGRWTLYLKSGAGAPIEIANGLRSDPTIAPVRTIQIAEFGYHLIEYLQGEDSRSKTRNLHLILKASDDSQIWRGSEVDAKLMELSAGASARLIAKFRENHSLLGLVRPPLSHLDLTALRGGAATEFRGPGRYLLLIKDRDAYHVSLRVVIFRFDENGVWTKISETTASWK